MSLNVSEANAANVLGEALLDLLGTKPDTLAWAQHTQHRRTQAAAVLLADAAYKRLGAGPRGADVAQVYTRLQAPDPGHFHLPSTGSLERLARIAALLGRPCPAPDSEAHPCPCATEQAWPCKRTQAIWLATGCHAPTGGSR